MENSINFTIVAPLELNFLLYLNNVMDPNKRFPSIQLHISDRDGKRKAIRDCWNGYIKDMENRGHYINYDGAENMFLEKILPNNPNPEKDYIIEQFTSWWFYQSVGGYSRLIEQAIAESNRLNCAREFLNIGQYELLLITYDEVPADFRTISKEFIVISQSKILNF